MVQGNVPDPEKLDWHELFNCYAGPAAVVIVTQHMASN